VTLKITFLGGVGTVTGSKYLVSAGNRRLLVDCGLFQGYKQLRLRNWAKLPVNPADVDAVLLTHAHLDHSGYLPLLVRNGFSRRIYCTEATRDLCSILLPDSGYLQEQDAEFANRHGFSKHHPALPLYTEQDAEHAMKFFSPVTFGEPLDLGDGAQARFLRAGHILGAAMIQLTWQGKTITFSGDMGRPNDPTMFPPEKIEETDYLLIESTYGNRKHDHLSAEDALAGAIGRTASRGGTVVIPSFAVGRAQNLLVYLSRLKRNKRIPDLPIFLDSPMALDATDIYSAHTDDHKMTAAETHAAFGVAKYIHTSDESRRLDQTPMPKVIISASGMATGGRVLHHLKAYAPDRRSLILFAGYQAGGTRGAAMLSGAQTIKIHGQYIPVRAEISELAMLSAHADADEIMAWLKNFRRAPKMTFVTHGEPAAADALRLRIADELGWPALAPEHQEAFDLA
jgi:metallo-beta-lactamase family protein